MTNPSIPRVETMLKPCPFCGGEAKLDANTPGDTFWVFCKKCGADVAGSKRTFVIDKWNTRT